jgi:hypothetical protein
VHARSSGDVEAAAVAACFDIGDGPLEPPPVVIEVIG